MFAKTCVAGAALLAVSITTFPLPEAGASPNWDAIAACESGGNWHINTGNGYHGGLQFTLGTWYGAGGQGLPENASREQQITVAENLYSRAGLSPWPVCGGRGWQREPVNRVPAPAAPEPPRNPDVVTDPAPVQGSVPGPDVPSQDPSVPEPPAVEPPPG